MNTTNKFTRIFLFLFLVGFTVSSFAQNTTGQTTTTTSMNQSMNMVQPFTGTSGYRKFSAGINVGWTLPSAVTGGVNDFTHPKPNIGAGIDLRYQFNHWYAIQWDGSYGRLSGDQSKPLFKGGAGNAYAARGVDAFKTNLFGSTLSSVLTFGNINWLNLKSWIVPYLSGGGGLLWYTPKIATNNTNTVADNAYYKNAGNTNTHKITELVVTTSAGAKIKLGDVTNLDLGYRVSMIDGDNLDGYKRLGPDFHRDRFSYGYVGLEFALGNKSKPRLLFDNPAASLQQQLRSEINAVRAMIQQDTDSDNDGVPDRLDKEPNTPAGCPVDVRGVSLDTDGDGVPDCRDKEKITPTNCFPVDADGVGKCPCPEACKTIMPEPGPADCATTLGSLPEIQFTGSSTKLSKDAMSILAGVAARLRNSPTCNIRVSGYCKESKAKNAAGTARVNAVVNYLVEKEGISRDRIMPMYAQEGGDCGTVSIAAQ